MILDAGDVPAMHQTTAVQAKEVLCRQFLFQACQGASHRELSVRMPDDAAWTVGFYSVQFVGMQNVNVSVRVSEAELAGAGSLGIEVLVQEFDGVLARIERRQERVRIGGVRHVQMHDARPVRRRGPYVGSMLLERHAALSADTTSSV